MKRLITVVLALLVVSSVGGGIYFWMDRNAQKTRDREKDADRPSWSQTALSKEEFMIQRAENIGFYRGIEKDKPFDPQLRIDAIGQLEKDEAKRNELAPSLTKDALLAAWTEIGPNPIPNGQVVTGPQLAVSGRTTTIAVHPTNPDIVYVGTAQGGLYRTLDGGTTWTPMLDNALSLAVNVVKIAPSQPDTIFVGTGESGFSADSFFGVGLYRITNASSGSPTISGPFGSTEFLGRSVSGVAIHPTDPNTIFVTSASGIGGLGGVTNNTLAARGIFRSTNALGATPTFTKLTVTGPATQDRAFNDVVIDPGDPNLVLATLTDSFTLGEGGVYRTTNALAATPTITRTFTAGVGTSNSRTELALHRSGGGVVTVYAASGTNGGTVQRSIDGGATWTQRIDNNFCTAQCFYDIAVDVDPTNADTVYVGGSPTLVFGRSTDGGTSFTTNAVTGAGVHADTHAIAVAPSLPTTVYVGTDGGIYKSTNSGTSWTSLNNSTFRATQFMSLDTHPTDTNFTIGGTQDNGTNFYQPAGTWTRADFGDGGFTVIDQNAPDTTNVRMYHTYFNQTSAMGYARVTSTASATEGSWTFFGCGFSGSTANGMTCTATAILFYAPMTRGPGNPNTLYFGSDVLYRSSDGGTTVLKVSQEPITSGAAISAIGVAPTNDNVRVIGQNNGGIFGTTTGSTTLVNMDPSNAIPNNYVGRIVIDPTDSNTAYVCLSAFGVVNVWKSTNLNALVDNLVPTWTAANTGLPQVPVNAFFVDPLNSSRIYAGTDIGVYVSTDAGASWVPFGTGLPRVAVFGMSVTANRVLRIATHGRGMWQIALLTPTAANVSVSGRVRSSVGSPVPRAMVTITDAAGQTRSTRTNTFGVFSFGDVTAGGVYTIGVAAKGYEFTPQTLTINDDLTDLDFTAGGGTRSGTK